MKKFNQKREKNFPFTHRFLSGLVIALAISLTAFEWTTTKFDYKLPVCKGCLINTNSDIEILPAIEIEKKVLSKPEPKPIIEPINPDILDIVPDTPEKINAKDDNLTVNKTQDDISHLFDIDPTKYGGEENPDLIVENIPYTKVEIFAHYDACSMLSGEELQICSQLEISNRIKKLFRISNQLRDIGGRQGAEMTFVIDEKGEIHSIKALQSTSKAITRDVTRAIKKLPKMNPAVQQGRAVSLQVKIPIVVNIN